MEVNLFRDSAGRGRGIYRLAGSVNRSFVLPYPLAVHPTEFLEYIATASSLAHSSSSAYRFEANQQASLFSIRATS